MDYRTIMALLAISLPMLILAYAVWKCHRTSMKIINGMKAINEKTNNVSKRVNILAEIIGVKNREKL